MSEPTPPTPLADAIEKARAEIDERAPRPRWKQALRRLTRRPPSNVLLMRDETLDLVRGHGADDSWGDEYHRRFDDLVERATNLGALVGYRVIARPIGEQAAHPETATVQAVNAMLEEERRGATWPSVDGPRWEDCRTVQFVDDRFEIIRVHDGDLLAVVEIDCDGGLHLEPAPSGHTTGAGDGPPYPETEAPPWAGPERWIACPECESTDESSETPCTNLLCPSHERRGTRVEERRADGLLTDEEPDRTDELAVDVDNYVHYEIRPTTIDGPPIPVGTEVGLKVLATIAGVDGIVLALRINDWAGPWVEQHNDPDPPVIHPRILDAATRAVERRTGELGDWTDVADWPREVASTVLEEIGRRIHPTNDEATSLALGVARLDVEKLRKTGDQMATHLRDLVAEIHRDGEGETVSATEDVLAVWQGQAHNDWTDHHARRRHV